MLRPLFTRPLLWPAILLAASMCGRPATAGEELSARQLMRFGVEAARQGLWREAAFRFERAVKADPTNARLRNDLAIAYESQGRFADADREYREARRLDPDDHDIRDNQESFQTMHPEFREADGAGPPASPAGHP